MFLFYNIYITVTFNPFYIIVNIIPHRYKRERLIKHRKNGIVKYFYDTTFKCPNGNPLAVLIVTGRKRSPSMPVYTKTLNDLHSKLS